jgi:hypothetical protein
MMVSTAPSSPSSPASVRRKNPMLKVGMSLAILVLLFSIYQTCAPSYESSLPLWLTFSSVSRASFISSSDISSQSQERHTSHLVESLAPGSLAPQLSPKFPTDASWTSSVRETGPSDVQSSEDKNEERGRFEAPNWNLTSVESRVSPSSATENNSTPHISHRPLQGTNVSELGSSPAEKVLSVGKTGVPEDPQKVSNSSDLSSTFTIEIEEVREGEIEVLSKTTPIQEGNSSFSTLSSSSAETARDKQTQFVLLPETTSGSFSSPSTFPEREKLGRGGPLTNEAASNGSAKDGETKGEEIPVGLALRNEQPDVAELSSSLKETASNNADAVEDASGYIPAPTTSDKELDVLSHSSEVTFSLLRPYQVVKEHP